MTTDNIPQFLSDILRHDTEQRIGAERFRTGIAKAGRRVNTYSLLIELDDGRMARVPVQLDFKRDGIASVVSLDSLIKARLWDAYISLTHFVQPNGPALPPEIAAVVER